MNAPSLDQIAHAVVSTFPKLSEPEQRVSLVLYRFLARGHGVTADQVSNASGVARDAVDQMLRKWHGVECREDGRHHGVLGLTLSKTKHLLRISGRELHAWCAWDTLFCLRCSEPPPRSSPCAR